MKTKILLAITVMCLTSFSMHAQVSLNNANTVEALIGAYPDMPSASTLGHCMFHQNQLRHKSLFNHSTTS